MLRRRGFFFMYSFSIAPRMDIPQLTYLLSNSNDTRLIRILKMSKGAVKRYKLIPADFMAVHSLRLAIMPILKTVAIIMDMGKAILMK